MRFLHYLRPVSSRRDRDGKNCHGTAPDDVFNLHLNDVERRDAYRDPVRALPAAAWEKLVSEGRASKPHGPGVVAVKTRASLCCRNGAPFIHRYQASWSAQQKCRALHFLEATRVSSITQLTAREHGYGG